MNIRYLLENVSHSLCLTYAVLQLFEHIFLIARVFLLAIIIVYDMPVIKTLYSTPDDVLITVIHCIN